MDSVSKLQDIAFRLDQIGVSGEWLANVLSASDRSAASTGMLIATLAEDVRVRLLELVTELEREVLVAQRHH